jgi:hypothetical protein
VGYGNELDLTVEFLGKEELEEPPFKVDVGDPFHLNATEHVPHALDEELHW